MQSNKPFSYTNEVIDELTEDLTEDDLVIGKVNLGQYPDDIADAVEKLIYMLGYKHVAISIELDPVTNLLSFIVIKRSIQYPLPLPDFIINKLK